MKVFLVILGILALIVLMIGGSIWSARGTLIDKTQAVDGQWAQVQNVYQRRLDLIPNLVAGINNFMTQQKATLTEVIGMRQRVIELKDQTESALKQQNPALLDSLSGQLSKQLNSFINVVVERYPDIKGQELYSNFMSQQEGTENRVAQERRVYNQVVQDYNAYRQKGVFALIAGSFFGYPYSREFFKADEEAQKAPDVRKAFDGQ